MTWTIDFYFAVAAVIGGIVRLISGLMNGDRLDWLMACGHVIVSAFAGWVCGKAMMAISPDLAMVTAAVSGYLGTRALDFASDFVKKKLSGCPRS